MTREEAIVTGLINGTNTVLNAIVRKLDEAGIMDRAQLAGELARAADEAERAMPEAGGVGRLDCHMMRNLAKLLRGEQPAPWTPTVIEGGKPE